MTGGASTDEDHMRRAIDLARANVGRTAENPSVGCVLVADGVVVGEGVTAPGGRPHAEERALDMAGPAARGATAYVTLEPCAKRSSGGASCSERLVAAGVTRVVIACADPSVFAAGAGGRRLTAAGVVVEAGLLEREAAELYAGYRPAGRL
ncbi:MAG: bifunctional diaminohydroxyphosphoribosylaminopyrimidine deaminase/5-amino-6-(5-phosphoribosylamino)uracil reductase RibD [Phenylobacterium sp.]|nr:bifunctional diaminohydroxyphosphoribosylaminopyrimidine deaminase/5-amino-6-(5-phosphoribosylamino)uracil reductase RibD [Phenylobacterium sp.]